MATVSYWLSGGGYSLVGLWLGKKEIFLPPAEVLKQASSYPELSCRWCPVGESALLWLRILNAISCIWASLVAQMVCNVGDLGLIPGLGRSPGGRNVNPL